MYITLGNKASKATSICVANVACSNTVTLSLKLERRTNNIEVQERSFSFFCGEANRRQSFANLASVKPAFFLLRVISSGLS